MKNRALLSATIFAATSGLVFGTMPSASALSWNWNYSGIGINASGTFTTNDTPDNLGFYLISGITGTHNAKTHKNGQTTKRLYLSTLRSTRQKPLQSGGVHLF